MEVQETTFKNWLKKQLLLHSQFTLKVLFAFLWITASVMFLTIIAGICKITYGIFLEFYMVGNNSNDGILKILHGLELIFLSPLVYFLLLALCKYFSVIKPEVKASTDNLQFKREYLTHAIHEINYVKLLTISLLISILVLHAISFLIVNKLDFTGLSILATICILLILILYYYVLDVANEKLRKEK
jgi:hypothetical protein